jgi:hypothetical protein
MEMMTMCCGMVIKRMGTIRVSMRKLKALIVNMEKVTLIGEGRNFAC